MKSGQEVLDRIAELRKVGDPASLSRAAELEWAVGLSDGRDDDSDEVTNFVLQNVPNGKVQKGWDSLPPWAKEHSIFEFSDKKPKEPAPKWPQRTDYGSDDDYETALEMYDDIFQEWAAKNFGVVFNEDDSRTKNERLELTKKFKAEGMTDDEVKNALYSVLYTKLPDKVSTLDKADLIASSTKDGMHRPMLDIDHPIHVLPSSTKGHGHLYIDKLLTWENYCKLQDVLVEVGLLESGYRGASRKRGYTALRLPWIKKTQAEKDRKDAGIAFKQR